MIVICPHCSARFKYDESRFGGSSSKRLKCSRCSSVFDVERPSGLSAQTVGLPAAGKKVDETTRELEGKNLEGALAQVPLAELAPLPANRRYSLAVILGANAGQIFPLSRPRVVMGRGAGCDLQLSDSEVSRQHAMLEIRGDEATLTDLTSTNGTYVDGVRIDKTVLTSHQEFSVGTSTIMFIVTESNALAGV